MTSRHADRKARPRALVTGGAVRLGRAIALALAEAGMDVAIAYHRSAAEARRTAHELQGHGVHGVALRADLRDPRAAGRLVGEAARRLGGLDVLVNSAAAFFSTPLARVTPARYDELLAVNLRGALFCAQAAAARMAAGGHVVNIGDAASVRPGWSAYAASKAGLEALTRALAAELRPRRIAVNCVAPGMVLKPERLDDARWRRIARGRRVSVDAVAAAVAFFATCPADLTGPVLRVDSGETA